MTDHPSDKLDQFMIRLPDGFRAKIKEAAKRNRRSMNGEIIHQLEVVFFPEQEAELEKQQA
ncbi:MAG: Arc family DNA-binding protein [Rhodobacteraceae bacterium]|nr:Arc family DNA-binding protein [Paracoccaceae bacterium]